MRVSENEDEDNEKVSARVSENAMRTYREGHGDNTVGTGDTVEDAYKVGEVVEHRQVVLHHDHIDVLGIGAVRPGTE